MKLLKSNTLKLVILVLVITLSLVYNQNLDFWQSVENNYFSVFFVILFSSILFILPIRKIELNTIDVIVIALLLLTTVSRIIRLGTVSEIYVLKSFTLIFYYLSVKSIKFKDKELSVYNFGIILVSLCLSVFSISEFYQVVLPTNYHWGMTGNFSNPGPLGGFIT